MKTTKRALLSSVVALILCFSMLVGTTFAWFTDEVTSGTNVIVAGNLDVELYHVDDKVEDKVNGEKVTTNTMLFDDVNPNLWEPGAMAYEILTVANEGTLALKYQLSLNATEATEVKDENGNIVSFASMLKVAVLEGTDAEEFDPSRVAVENLNASLWTDLASFAKIGTLAARAANEEKNPANTYVVIIWWQPSANDNLFNMNNDKEAGSVSVKVGVKLVATQVEANLEQDSFGSDYDNGAFIPVAPESVPEEGGVVVNGSAESGVTVDVPAAVVNNLPDDVTSLAVNASAPVVDTTNKTVSFSTVELVDQNGKEVDLSNSTAKVTVTLPVGGAFADGEQVEVYHDGAFVTYATVANGKISYEVSHFCEVELKVAEEVVLDNTIDSVKEFMAFAAAVNDGKSYKGETVTLGADLDLAGVTWSPIGTSANPFKGTFDGNGKVIKNLSVLMAGKSDVGLFGNTQNGEIKNVTVENAKVAGRLNVGVVAGTPYTSKYTNITVKGHVEVDGMAYVGAVGGKNAYADWTDITVNVDATSYVNANSVEKGTAYRTYVGGVVGFNGEGGHSFTNITSNINVIGSTCDIGGAFGIAHYNNKFENVTATGTVTCTGVSDEIGGVIGVWHNENGTTVTLTNCKYEGESNVSVVGAPYNANGTGKLIVDGVEVAASAATLQAQLNAATGDATINLFCDIKGDVTVTQKEGVNVVINGNGYKYDGTIYIHGQARHNGAETLTIKNINFVTEGTKDFISSNETGSVERYAHNVTVQNCTFTGDKTLGAVGMRLRQAYNIKIENCTATKMHSLLQANGCSATTITVNNCEITASKNGVAFNNTMNAVITNCEIESVADYGYGVRVDANGAYNLTATGNSISADVPVLFRKATAAYTATLTDNTLTSKSGHTVLATAGDYEEGKDCPAATGDLKVTVNGVTAVVDGDSLKAALAEGNNVIFMNDITMAATESNAYGKTGINVKNGQTIDGNGFTLKVTGAGATWDSAISTTGGVIKNLTVAQGFRGIFVNHNSTYSDTVVLENVIIQGPTYTISCDQGMNQNLVATNCTINGWTSYAKTIGTATFTNCSFGKGAGYQFCRPYAPTEFIGCKFSEGYTVDTASATVTFTDCTGLN